MVFSDYLYRNLDKPEVAKLLLTHRDKLTIKIAQREIKEHQQFHDDTRTLNAIKHLLQQIGLEYAESNDTESQYHLQTISGTIS